jgi:two-component system response regulator HydG
MDQDTILIVDDDEMILESLVSILENEGYITYTAKTGQEALDQINSSYFNVLLIDIKLPDMTGIDLLSKIKDATPRMKKLILTGYPDTPSAIEAVNKKANAYLIKPFDPEDLLDLIAENIRHQKEELKYTQEKVLDFIKERVKKLDEIKKIEKNVR